jgi:hypothetical protein
MSPVLGPVRPKFAAIFPEDDSPNPTEGTYFSSGGWYEYASKDLQTPLGQNINGPFTHRYCGAGNLKRRRASLWAAIQSAVTKLAAGQGTNPLTWRASADAERLIFIPSLIPNTMRRTNRPAFQQAISFDSHR